MTDDEIRTIVKIAHSAGFSSGALWMASDKKPDSCKATIDETFKQNVEWFLEVTLANNALM